MKLDHFLNLRLAFFVFTCLILEGVSGFAQCPTQNPAVYPSKYCKEEIITTSNGTEYIVRNLPVGDNVGKSLPVLVDLHGAGAIKGEQMISIKGNKEDIAFNGPKDQGLVSLVRENDMRALFGNMLIVLPYLPRDPSIKRDDDQLWDPKNIDAVIEDLKKRFDVDANRIYMSGISLGAKGVWDYALAYPQKVAAIIPIAGNANPTNICSLTNGSANDVAVWALHGLDDGVVNPLGESKNSGRYGSKYLVDALTACSDKNYNPRVTLLRNVKHEKWDQYYNNSGGFYIYDYVRKISKNNTANISPFVDAGGPDLKIKSRTEPMTLLGSSFDVDGSIAKSSWRKVSGPSVDKMTSNKDTLVIQGLTATGIYTFEYTVEDDGGSKTSDQITLEVLENDGDNAITAFELLVLNGAGSAYTFKEAINNTNFNYVLKEGVADRLSFRAVSSSSTTGSVKFTLNNHRNFFTTKYKDNIMFSVGQPYVAKAGDVLHITATPYSGSNGTGTAGVSRVITVRVLADQDAQPVTFFKFEGKPEKAKISLDWATSSEINNDFFTVERSADAVRFQPIGTVPGAGNSTAILSYHFEDRAPLSGINYYRIRQQDFDGQFDYSKIIQVDNIFGDRCVLSVFPNPAAVGQLQLNYACAIAQSPVEVSIFNGLGERVYAYAIQPEKLENSTIPLEVSLPAGLYICLIQQENRVSRQKLVIKDE